MSNIRDPYITYQEIQDPVVRRNFENLARFFLAHGQLYGFKMLEREFKEAGSGLKWSHGLGIVPQDILVTKAQGSGTITWNWDSFDSEHLDVTVSGPCTVRVLVGTYRGGVS